MLNFLGYKRKVFVSILAFCGVIFAYSLFSPHKKVPEDID